MADLLPDLLDAALSQDVPSSRELPPLGEVIGNLTRAGRTEMAELLAGTTDKRSRDYKTARRRVERWQRRGVTRITPKSRRQIEGARRVPESRRLRAFRSRGADMRVLITWYQGQREEWLPPGGWLRIKAASMRAVIRYWSEDDPQTAAAALYSAFLKEYKVPNYDDWANETEVIDLELEPVK